jgi:hypothetical protein
MKTKFQETSFSELASQYTKNNFIDVSKSQIISSNLIIDLSYNRTKNNFMMVSKTVFLTIIILLFSIHIKAQSTNKQTETKTTTSTIKDSNGEHKTVKKEVTNEVQKIELGKEKSNTVNIPTIDSPINVTTTTKVTNPDGSTRTVDIDRSSYYESNGNKYKLALDASGYILTYGTSKPALLRKTSTNSYIFRSESKTAIGYFDTNGDLIVEIYDDKSDKVTVEKYRAIKE